METCYLGDETVKGENCRVFMTTADPWMSDLGITAGALLPEGEKDPNASHYKFHGGRGGDLLFKRIQWVDKETGIVVKAEVQSRTILWIEDDRVPLEKTIADIDNKTILTGAQVTLIEWVP